ncbi:MAG: NADH-quinone oxidoreductase subunit C [Candidatus Stygibacter australis]|nr:NADH-quinone oxidoreductase subunit C [Candidatus Stygibacter australis]MDP8322292.1 NADH-quinone oxidoreductase subunit C [Candidatus Stygibacter australis]
MKIENFIEEVRKKYPDIKVEEINLKRLMIYISKELLLDITSYLFATLGFRYIIVSGMDSKEGYEIIYHYSDDSSGWVINLNVMLPHDKPEVESITPVVYGAEWIEREIMDLLGIKFLNHPKPERFLMAESWPEGDFPLRRKENKEL